MDGQFRQCGKLLSILSQDRSLSQPTITQNNQITQQSGDIKTLFNQTSANFENIFDIGNDINGNEK